jgi:SAM-dependent methyltransferase
VGPARRDRHGRRLLGEGDRGGPGPRALEARFVLSTVYELGDVLDEEFDVVYASRGALGWLPSIERWAGVAARYVRPGGFLYLHEGHPVLWTFDETQTHSNPVRLAYGYWEGDVITTRPEGSYADRAAQVEAQAEHGWNHGLGEVVTALAKRGLHIEFLHEQDFLSWPESFLTRAEETPGTIDRCTERRSSPAPAAIAHPTSAWQNLPRHALGRRERLWSSLHRDPAGRSRGCLCLT